MSVITIRGDEIRRTGSTRLAIMRSLFDMGYLSFLKAVLVK
jgi:hypothetical protein